MIHEPHSTEEATQHAVHILDAKYEKADLQSVVDNNCPHLSLQDQNKLLELLRKYKDLFDGTLGDWNTEPVSFKLKEGAKPYHGRAYPVPHSVKETLMKELKRLCDLGVLQWQPASEWASPSFIVPKEDQTEHFLSDFREVNKRVVRKPFSLPKISTFMQELEGFTFATPLDLNMGYYTIRLDPDASKICIIIFPWDFEIYTDASSKQLGAVITQNNRSIAFFSRKLFVCQQTYSVTKIELLAIVETLKEFKGMLWGQSIELQQQAVKVGWTKKHCVLCKKHGGPHKSHNTRDCRRYNKDGTPIKKNGGAGKPGSKERKPEGANFAQIVRAELKKALRKKSSKHRKRRANDSESDSDSDESS
eukprot:CCRYP_005341-RB/>CCRYP_005341-RB protein AED:0.20 eAED:0.20 QI:0/0/0/1/0/0/3/3948/361